MPRRRKIEYLNSQNAQSVANRGNNAAFSQSHGVLQKGADGKWSEGAGYTRTRSGRMSTDGKRAGGLTHAFTDKDKGKQSGRGGLATRRQRYYDVRLGLGLSGG